LLVARVQEFQSHPNDAIILVQDERVEEIRPFSQAAGSPDGNLVVRLQFALNANCARSTIGLGPHGLVSIDQQNGAELRTLFGAPCKFFTGERNGRWNRGTFRLPTLDRPATDPELFGRLRCERELTGRLRVPVSGKV
jgi:hypothetical protein